MEYRRVIPDPDDPIDRAVLDFQQGIRREESYEQIVRRYYGSVKSFLLKRGLSPEDCFDLNQETFLNVYTGLDGYAWKAKFPSWLFTIAANVYRNWRSGESRRGAATPSVAKAALPASGEESEPIAINDEEDPLAGLLSEEQRDLLRAAVDELPPKMRSCVELRMRDFDYQEIADAMQLSIGTVKAHLHVAREKLRVRLSDVFGGIDF